MLPYDSPLSFPLVDTGSFYPIVRHKTPYPDVSLVARLIKRESSAFSFCPEVPFSHLIELLPSGL